MDVNMVGSLCHETQRMGPGYPVVDRRTRRLKIGIQHSYRVKNIATHVDAGRLSQARLSSEAIQHMLSVP